MQSVLWLVEKLSGVTQHYIDTDPMIAYLWQATVCDNDYFNDNNDNNDNNNDTFILIIVWNFSFCCKHVHTRWAGVLINLLWLSVAMLHQIRLSLKTVSINGLPPSRCQAITYINVELLIIMPLRTSVKFEPSCIQTFIFQEMNLKTPSSKWWPFCSGLIVLKGTKQCNSIYLKPKTRRRNSYIVSWFNTRCTLAIWGPFFTKMN